MSAVSLRCVGIRQFYPNTLAKVQLSLQCISDNGIFCILLIILYINYVYDIVHTLLNMYKRCVHNNPKHAHRHVLK